MSNTHYPLPLAHCFFKGECQMLRKIFISIILLMVFTALLHAQNLTATVDYLAGKAEIMKDGSASWSALSEGMTVSLNDTIKTYEKSAVDLKFDNKTFSRIGASSEIKLKESEESSYEVKKLFFKKKLPLKKINLKINKGRLLSKVGALNEQSSFKVTTPVAVVGVRGTTFDASHGASTSVKCIAGSVSVLNPSISAKPIVVPAGQSTTIEAGAEPSAPAAMSSAELSDVGSMMGGDAGEVVIAPPPPPPPPPVITGGGDGGPYIPPPALLKSKLRIRIQAQ